MEVLDNWQASKVDARPNSRMLSPNNVALSAAHHLLKTTPNSVAPVEMRKPSVRRLVYPFLAPTFLASNLRPRAVRRARRAGSTGSVRRVTDPFRQGLWNFFDGTATGRFFDSTAVEITAVDGRQIL
jgi:hypothetical protein